MSQNTSICNPIFVQIIIMKFKYWMSKIDFTLMFRLLLGIVMMITGYVQNDYTSGSFGLFLVVYAFIAAKYKIGCGYNACGYSAKYTSADFNKSKESSINFTEIK